MKDLLKWFGQLAIWLLFWKLVEYIVSLLVIDPQLQIEYHLFIYFAVGVIYIAAIAIKHLKK